MATTSYGTITIVDNTDLGQLSAYLTTDKYRQQVYNVNDGTWYPDWIANSSYLTITPNIFYNGSPVDLLVSSQPNPQLSITWYENSVNITTGSSSTAVVQSNRTCRRISNLANVDGQRNVVYRADIKYYPVSGDSSLFLVTSVEIELNLNITGTNAAAPKSLQLTGSKAYFTYDWQGNIYGGNSSVLTVSKSLTIAGIFWYYTAPDGNGGTVETLLTNNIVNGGDNSAFIGDSFTLSTATQTQSSLFSALASLGQLGFRVRETDGNAVNPQLISNGFTDYFSIFRYQEAAPGDTVYTAYVDNNEETVTVYDNILDLSGAVSKLYINKDGRDDSAHWHISVTDNIGNIQNFAYAAWNTKDYPNGILKGISSTTISNGGTQAPTINGVSIATSTLTTNDMVIYNGSVFYWNGTNWVLPNTTNTTTYGPDKVAVTLMNVNTAAITFRAEHGTYNGTTFTRDEEVSDLINIFTVSKNQSIVSHSLRLSTANINRSATGQYTPNQVVLDAITRTGGSTSQTSYRDAGVIKYTISYTSGADTTGQNTANNPVTLDLSSETREITQIVVTLGTASPWEDTQTVTVSKSGSSPYNINVFNLDDTISTTFDYKPSADYLIDVPFAVLQGIDELDVNCKINNSTAYPRVSVGNIYNSSDTSLGVVPSFYYNDTAVTTASRVNKVKATLSTSLTIGTSGYFDLLFELSADYSKTVRYKYVSSPEALDAIALYVQTDPGDKFVNQEGKIIITPVLLSGVTAITSGVTYTWEIYRNGWKRLKNSATTQSETTWYHDDYIFFDDEDSPSRTQGDTNIINGTINSKYLHVFGYSVPSYTQFRLTVSRASGNTTLPDFTVVEYISLTDESDPIQVSVLSTVGDKLTNGQGQGVIYAKVTMNQDEVDEIKFPLGFGTDDPPTVSTTAATNMLGYVVKVGNVIKYYARNTTADSWPSTATRLSPGTTTTATYHWTFRDSNNKVIVDTDLESSSYLYSIIHNNANTQFVYVDKDIVNKKLTADVEVSITPTAPSQS